MGRLSMPQKRKKDVYTVDRVWDRKVDEDGAVRYLTSWKGYSEKTWEPLEHFTEEAIELVRDLERMLDDPDNNPKPQWLLEFEEMKAAGVDVVKRTPGHMKSGAARARGTRSSSRARSSSTGPSAKRDRREDSTDSSSRRTSRKDINYSDVPRRATQRRPGGDSSTPTRPTRAAAAAAPAAEERPGSSRAEERAESEEERAAEQKEELVEAQTKQEDDASPSSSSTVAADDAAPKEASPKEERKVPPLRVEVPAELRVPLVLSPPALPLPSDLPAASPASTVISVLSESKFDSAGVLLPLEGGGDYGFEPFDWAAHIANTGGEPAPISCFWRRPVGKFNNPFGQHIGRTLKVPDNDEEFTNEWCTIGTVKAVHGPWVQVHALDTDPALAEWFMADDSCIQPFITLSDPIPPKCKEPNKRRSTGSYKRIIERAVFDANGGENRVPRECFEQQLKWKNRPIDNLFKLGHKLETYDPVRGEGCFYPATIVEVNEVKETIKVHYDGYPESHTKQVLYKDCRLFPCGYAAAIGWKCLLPLAVVKKSENRGRKKVSTGAAPISPALPRSTTPTPQPPSRKTTTQPASSHPPNNNNEKAKRKAAEPRRSDGPSRARPTTYREQSTPDEDSEEEEEDDHYVSRNPPHRTRAPPIPGLQKRVDDSKKVEPVKKIVEPLKVVVVEKRKEVPMQTEKVEEPVAKKPARQLTPLRMEDFEKEKDSEDPNKLPVTAVRLSHSGYPAKIFLNHECNVGVNIHPTCFRAIPSKMSGSIPHLWREILQQLLNSSIDSKQFVDCLPKYTLAEYQVAISVTYDDAQNSMVAHFIQPPANIHVARKLLARILKEAGMCPNAVTFDQREVCKRCQNQDPSDNKVIEILRMARQQQQELLHKNQQFALHQQQQQQLLQQAQVRQHTSRVVLQNAQQQPRTPPIVPVMPPMQQLLQPARPQAAPPNGAPPRPPAQPPSGPPRQQAPPNHVPTSSGPPRQAPPSHAAPPRPQAPPSAPGPSGQQAPPPSTTRHAPVLDDPNRFLLQKVNIKSLTETEILEMLQALEVPKEVIAVFEAKKINWRTLLTLNEDIMVRMLRIPSQWAKRIHNYIEANKGD